MSVALGTPDVAKLYTATKTAETAKEVDSTDNLKDDRIYLFSGQDDTVVDPKVMQALQTYYQYFVEVNNIVSDFAVPAEHCLPTLDYGEVCNRKSSPYIGKCNFDGAGIALTTLYGDLKTGTAIAANLIEFDQTPFFSGSGTSISSVGYAYIPTACQNGASCHLHINFHGCEQNLETIGNQYAADTGFNGYAEANNIIVVRLFPRRR